MAKDHIARIIADTKQFDAKITASMRVLQSFNQYINEVGAGNVNFSKTEQDVVKGLGQFEVSATTTEGAVKQLNMMLRELTNTYRKLDSATKATDVGQSMARSIEQLQGRLKVAQADLAAMGGDTSVAAAGGGKNIFGKIMGGNLAARAVMGTMRMLGRTIKDAVQANMEFEYSQATLAAVLGKSKEEIIGLTNQAKKLGSTSLYSAKEISELQVVLARLGFTIDEINDSTGAIAKLALATGVDLSRAAELTGASMRAFGYDTKEAARVAAVLGVSTTKSALDMEKLRTAMSYASSSAAAAGFEIEEVVAMLGKMVDRGQQATTAGVNIRNIMLDLNSASSKLRRAIKIATGRDNIRGFEDLIEALREMRQAGISLDDVGATIQRRVTPGFLNLLANTEGVHELAEELRGCTGELDAMAEKMEDTLSGATTKMKNSWNAFVLELSHSHGVLFKSVQMLDKLADAMTKEQIFKNGGQRLVNYYDRDMTEGEKRGTRKNVYGILNNPDKSLVDKFEQSYLNSRSKTVAKRDEVNKYFDAFYAKGGNGLILDPKKFKELENLIKEFEEKFPEYKGLMGTPQLAKEIAGMNLEIKRNDYALSLLKPGVYGDSANGESIAGNAGLGLAEKLNGSKDTVDTALKNYALAVNEAKMEYEAGMIDKKQYDQKILNAMESVYKAYGTAAYAIADPKLKKELTDALNDEQTYLDRQFQTGRITQEEYDKQVHALTNKYADLSRILENSDYKQQFNIWANKVAKQAELVAEDDLNDKVAQANMRYYQALSKAALEKEAGVIDEIGFAKAQLAAQEQLTKIYEELALETNTDEWKNAYTQAVQKTREYAENLARLMEELEAKKAVKALDSRILRGLQSEAKRAGVSYESVGLTGLKSQIDEGIDIDEKTWNDVADKLNAILGKQKYYIAIDFETGSIEKMTREIVSFGDTVGALQSLSSGFQSLKTSTEDLFETLNGEGDMFDKFFASLDYGLGILQTFVSMQKAAELLSSLSEATKKKETAATIADTGATLANAAAKGTEASAAGAAAAAEGGKAVSGIPIVGPILAVAAIAAIAAAIASANRKTEYHAGGGFVGMNGISPFKPMGTDTVPAMLTPGELILNRSMQSNLAGQLEGAGRQMIQVNIAGRVSGRELRLVMDNDNRAAGGTRGIYARTH